MKWQRRKISGDVRKIGLIRCHSVWECPTCASRIRAARARELEHVITWHRARWGAESVWMLTLTVRHHGAHHSLREVRKGLAAAWRQFISGRAWQLLEQELGLEGSVRALEVTHGPIHGWHPHLHVLFLTRGPVPEGFRQRAHARWAEAVQRTLGQDYTPTLDGVVVTADPRADYPLKMGIRLTLELLSTGSKQGREGPDGALHRAPMQILADYCQRGQREEDRQLYYDFVEGMAGARMLTWSVGLRKRAALAEVDEALLAEGDPVLPGEEPWEDVGVASGPEWDRVRRIPGAAAALDDVAFQWGTEGLYYALDVLLAGLDPEDVDELRKHKRPRHPDEMQIVMLLPRRGGPVVRIL